jgi:rhodanese-related sulfurtransferase
LSTVEWITPEEAKAMLDRNEAVVVDVREPAEIAVTGKVPGAREIPHRMIAESADPHSRLHDPSLRKDVAVILYCASGKRSAVAGEALVDLGFDRVFNLGGLKDWDEAGFPIAESGAA